MRYRKLKLTITLLAITGVAAYAQTDSAKTAAAAKAELERKKWDEAFHKDWSNVARYHDANVQHGPFKAGEKGVVYMGDSITDFWIGADPSFWNGKPYVNRGISGQTTTQMLVRFRQDVINLKPAVVVILAGINDIAQNNGPIEIEDVAGNIKSMAVLAKDAGIKVVISSVLPAYAFPWRPAISPADKVGALNAMLRQYAEDNHIVYLDYFSKMADQRNGLPKELAEDGVHPTLAGYRVMEPMVEAAITKALKR